MTKDVRGEDANGTKGKMPRNEKLDKVNKKKPNHISFFVILQMIFQSLYVLLKDFFLSFTKKPKSLEGKVILVTGSGRGIGRELCLQLHKQGAVLACADIDEKNNLKTVELLGSRATSYTLNIASKKQVEKVAEQIEKDLGPVDVLINNAALVMGNLVSEWNEEEIRSMFNVNILGAFWTMSVFLPKMRERNDGHIVNISSMSSLSGVPFLSIYGSTKAALSNLSESVHLELLFLNPKNNVKMTTVRPFFVDSRPHENAKVGKGLRADMSTVVSDIVDAIRFEKSAIVTPKQYFFITFLSILSYNIQSIVLKPFVSTIRMPTKEFKEKIKYDTLVESCSDPYGVQVTHL